MIERYQDNLKGQLIEYQGKTLYVVDQINYNGKIYAYTINAKKFDETEELEINIFEKTAVDELKVVTDMKVFDAVLANYGGKVIADEIRKLDLNKN